MKIVKITSAYAFYLNKFYESRSSSIDSSEKTYHELQREYFADRFGWADFWGTALRPYGYEVSEIVANNQVLQTQWALENSVVWPGEEWIQEIARKQVISEAPDVLFMDDYHHFSSAWISELRAACPSIRLVLGWCGAPFQDSSVFQAYDLVLSNIPELVETFRKLGKKSHHLHHGFGSEVLSVLKFDRAGVGPLSFVGQISSGNKFHEDRRRLLEVVSDHCPIQIYSPLGDLGLKSQIKVLFKNGLIAGRDLISKVPGIELGLKKIPSLGPKIYRLNKERFRFREKLKPYLKPSVFGVEMYQTLIDSCITLNHHIDLSASWASNMRLFEATGVGTCLLTDWKSNLKDLFVEDSEVVSFRSVEECLEKTRWLLDHPKEAQEIGRRGQARVMNEHTFGHRAPHLDLLIRENAKRLGPVLKSE